jgi:hypothetical protein
MARHLDENYDSIRKYIEADVQGGTNEGKQIILERKILQRHLAAS